MSKSCGGLAKGARLEAYDGSGDFKNGSCLNDTNSAFAAISFSKVINLVGKGGGTRRRLNLNVPAALAKCANHAVIQNHKCAIVGQTVSAGLSVKGVDNVKLCIQLSVPANQQCGALSTRGIVEMYANGSYSQPLAVTVETNAQGQFCFAGAQNQKSYVAVLLNPDWASTGDANGCLKTPEPEPEPEQTNTKTKTPAPTPAPAPPPPVIIKVVTKVFNPAEKAAAKTEITAALDAAKANSTVTMVKVASSLGFPIALSEIKPGSVARKEFEAGFVESMSSALSGFSVIVDSIDAVSRRLLASLTENSADRRRLGSTVKVNFHMEAPESVAALSASLVTTLASSGSTINVTVGGKKLSAPASAVATPVVSKEPDVDCVGEYSACSSACRKLFVVSKSKGGRGKACSAAHNNLAYCTTGICAGTKMAGATMAGAQLISLVACVLVSIAML